MADATSEIKKDKDSEETINLDDIKGAVKSALSVLDPESEAHVKYDHYKSAEWITKISESVLEKCVKIRKPFKYVVNAVIAHRAGAGLHVCSSAHFGPADGVVSEVHEMNDTIFCAVTVYYVAL